MSRQFTTTIHPRIMLFGNELPLIATVQFTHVPAYPGHGPTYSSGGQPPEPESVEDVEITELVVDGTAEEVLTPLDRPRWLCDWIIENADESELLDAVDYGPDPDAQRDAMQDREMRRDRGELDDGAEE